MAVSSLCSWAGQSQEWSSLQETEAGLFQESLGMFIRNLRIVQANPDNPWISPAFVLPSPDNLNKGPASVQVVRPRPDNPTEAGQFK